MTMRTLDLDDIRRMAVIDSGNANKIGVIHDIVVHPTEGRLVGVVIRSESGGEFALPLDAFRIGDNAVMSAPDAPLEVLASSAVLKEGVTAAETLVGANIVTDDGRLLGKVNDVVVIPEMSLIVYKVAGNVLQKIFGSGYYIAGDLPSAMSTDGVRLIVPGDTEEMHAAGSIKELFDKGGTPDADANTEAS